MSFTQAKYIVEQIQSVLLEVGKTPSFIEVVDFLSRKEFYPDTTESMRLAALAWLIEENRHKQESVAPSTSPLVSPMRVERMGILRDAINDVKIELRRIGHEATFENIYGYFMTHDLPTSRDEVLTIAITYLQEATHASSTVDADSTVS
jgi:hypothetical protein